MLTLEELDAFLELVDNRPVLIFLLGMAVREVVGIFELFVRWMTHKLLGDQRKETKK